MSYKLNKPYTEKQRMDFIVEYNHNQGLRIEEGVTGLYALEAWELLEGDDVVNNKEAWKEKQAQAERERIAKLTCTKRVFALMLQELGITYTMLKQLIATNEQAQLEWDLSVQLERGNPLLDVMALQLGITSEQLDGLFRYANGEITIEQFRELIPEPDVDNPEEVEEEKTVDTEVEVDEV